MATQPVIVLVFLAASLFSLAPAASQQEPVQIVGPPSCGECAVDMELEVTLRDRLDLNRPIVASTRIVVRDTLDRLLVVHGQDLVHIQVSAPDGSFLKSVGGAGQGPGEFGSLSALAVGNEGDLYAFDWQQQRVTRFSPDFELVETSRLPLRTRAAVFASGGLTVAARGFSNELVGLSLHFWIQGWRSSGLLERQTKRYGQTCRRFRCGRSPGATMTGSGQPPITSTWLRSGIHRLEFGIARSSALLSGSSRGLSPRA